MENRQKSVVIEKPSHSQPYIQVIPSCYQVLFTLAPTPRHIIPGADEPRVFSSSQQHLLHLGAFDAGRVII